MDVKKIEECLDILQEQNNILYEELGANYEIIDLQIAINQIRNKYNIPDKTKMVESNPGFVQ